MQRLSSIQPEVAEGRVKQLFDQAEQTLGAIPNATRVMANSPAVLESYLLFATAMNDASIGEKLHNQVKLNISEANACEYCTSLLGVVAPKAGLSAEDILAARSGSSDEQRIKAALTFAADVLESRGKVSDEQLAAVKDVGFDDAAIVEIVASVVLGCFTNFLNNVAVTELDVPAAQPLSAPTCNTGVCST